MQAAQKYRACKKKESSSIAALQRQLFEGLESAQKESEQTKQLENPFDEFQEHQAKQNACDRFKEQLLGKAKRLTYSNKNKIEKMRREISRMQKGETDFMTGVGLFEKEQPIVEYGEVDEGAMLRNLTSSKFDDLEQLRRMIKKTEHNLKKYSHSVYKTQTKVVNAADQCGWDLDVGLAIKINRCNLDQVFSNQTKPKTPALSSGQVRRRTASSYNSRRTKV